MNVHNAFLFMNSPLIFEVNPHRPFLRTVFQRQFLRERFGFLVYINLMLT